MMLNENTDAFCNRHTAISAQRMSVDKLIRGHMVGAWIGRSVQRGAAMISDVENVYTASDRFR
jgi:hypothetical protein